DSGLACWREHLETAEVRAVAAVPAREPLQARQTVPDVPPAASTRQTTAVSLRDRDRKGGAPNRRRDRASRGVRRPWRGVRRWRWHRRSAPPTGLDYLTLAVTRCRRCEAAAPGSVLRPAVAIAGRPAARSPPLRRRSRARRAPRPLRSNLAVSL